MATLLGPVLALGGFGLYMLDTSRGRFRRVPWEFLALSGLGVLVSAIRLLTAPGPGTIAGAVSSGAVLGLMAWLFFVKSNYGAREDRPRVGDLFPDFRLPASDGGVYDFAAAHGKLRLLIFYRGSW